MVVLHDGFTTFKNKRKLPIENLEKRTRNLIDCGLVDIIKYTFEPEPVNTFNKLLVRYHMFDITFYRGDDWPNFPGREAIEAHSIPIVLVPYTKGISSSKLRNEL
jgi:IS1 family transposase